ncbi:MAG: response regulator [Synechococcales cyanobacterium RU_4_20]|nr:response regulator [Synechococcales cyanobacterium RU_4_20]
MLEQLRLHRRTLSDLQSAAQQIGLDEWGIDHQPETTPKISSVISIPQLPLSAQFDSLEMDRYSDLHICTQKALNEAVQLEIVIEAIDQHTKSNRRTRDSRQRLFGQLRDDLAAVRLKPISELFNRFPRVVQQLSTTYNKKVSLILTGSQVLVDKVTLDSLYDSLLHLVRNGFDHGIEASEQRMVQGKPAEGKIELRAYQQGNRTVIEVRDDGQGVNLERIAAKAIEQGLIDAANTEEISEAALLDFLFHSGFSTASKLSELSGRGVGLDVVRAQIEKLDGEISIRSEPGQGTTFILSMPLSMTITKQLICKSGGSTYAIAAHTIEQVLLPNAQQLRDLGDGRWVFELCQGDVTEQVPVQPLAQLIQYAHGAPHSAQLTAKINVEPILLIDCPDGLRGIQVDQVIGEQEVSIRALGSAIVPPRYIQGCTVLGDSHLALAIEPNILLTHTYETTQARHVALNLHQQPSRSSATRLLIVDDSLTQRRTLERSLQTAGYEIIQAEDGLDALVSLKQDGEVALIVCDLEMPRMNGFEFISQTRTLPGICDIPIVILTSRSGSKYRQLALELGAAAFLSKPYTDYELLNTVGELLQALPQVTLTNSQTNGAPPLHDLVTSVTP